MKRFILLSGLLLLCSAILVSQEAAPQVTEPLPETPSSTDESIDQLFTDSTGDVIADPNAKVDISTVLLKPVPGLSGQISLSGAASAGWSQLNSIEDWETKFDGSFYYDLSSSLGFDYRPDSVFHWAASLSATLAARKYEWSGISIGEMYVDYTLLDTVFFRLGKFGAAWGVGRLFNIGNLVSGASSGVSLKSFAPLGPINWTMMVMAQPDLFTDKNSPVWMEIALASLFETSIGPLNIGLSGFFEKNMDKAPPQIDLYLKTALLGADVFAESRLSLPVGKDPYPLVDVGFFWEGLTPKLKIQAEYKFDGANYLGTDHSLGIGTALSNIPGFGITISAKWLHAFVDNSGQFAFVLEGDPLAHIHATLAFQYCYGPANGRYLVAENGDPLKRALALGIKIDLSAGF